MDWAGPLEGALAKAWSLATGDETARAVEAAALDGIEAPEGIPEADGPLMEEARQAILACARAAAGVPLAEALEVQAVLAAEFLAGAACRKGVVGADWVKTVQV